MSGLGEYCNACNKEFNEFNIRVSMKCPNYHAYRDVIKSFMPKFKSDTDMQTFIELMEKGEMKTSGWSKFRSEDDEDIWSPDIPALENALKGQMRHEPVNGAWYHSDFYVCAECVEKSRKCPTCEIEHDPTCSICKAKLVPV